MKYFIKKIYFILFLVSILFLDTETFGKDKKVEYSRKNISNYLSGIVSVNQDYTNAAFRYLNKVQSLKMTILISMFNLFVHLFYLKNLNKHLLFQKIYGLKTNTFLKLIFC